MAHDCNCSLTEEVELGPTHDYTSVRSLTIAMADAISTLALVQPGRSYPHLQPSEYEMTKLSAQLDSVATLILNARAHGFSE